MPSIRLTQRRVDALRPRRKVRDVRDAELKGYGVRVMPSGARRYFIHSQHRGKRVWKIIGDAAAIAEPEARARAMLAALRDGREPEAADPGGTLFETVGEEVFDRYGRRWKPRTLDVNRAYLRRQILPFFAGRPIGEITQEDVRAWFRGLHATPAAANRSAPVLSVIMQQAEVWGYRPEDSNPCAGIRRYRQGRSERFLTPEEYRRLAAVLGRNEAARPLHVAALRLLLLTGCRKSEILTLQWRSYREGRLYLPDSKTGPRTVWLCEAARDILDRLPRSSGFVFPVAGLHIPWLWLDYFWRGVCQRRLKIRPKGGAKYCHLGWWSELGVRLGVGDTVRGFFGGSEQRSHAELKRSAPAGRPQGGMVYRVGVGLATRASEARCRPGPGDDVPQLSYRHCFCGRGFG